MTIFQKRQKAGLAHGRKLLSTFASRFWASVDKNGPKPKNQPGLGRCWNWKGWIEHNGYGRVRRGGKKLGAHRAAYELAFGPIPTAIEVLHKCDNRKCQNPKHLFLGSQADNIQDSVKKERWHGAKLTIVQVREIRKARGVESTQTLADRFRVTRNTIQAVLSGRCWKCVL